MKQYTLDKMNILLPDDHKLDVYQHDHKLYDRFVPYLALSVAGKGTIVDVGANVGDTACVILANCKNNLICCEAETDYFDLLQKNISANFSAEEIKSRVKYYQRMIGTGMLRGHLNRYDGSARLIESDTPSEFHSIDSILKESSEAVVLIKSDVDGFDYDVLNSAKETIEKHEPIIFFECEVIDENAEANFRILFDYLQSKNYSSIYLFDNFGNVLFRDSDFDSMNHINSYLTAMRNEKSTRTFYFCDILCATNKHHELIDNAVMNYINELIIKKT